MPRRRNRAVIGWHYSSASRAIRTSKDLLPMCSGCSVTYLSGLYPSEPRTQERGQMSESRLTYRAIGAPCS